MSETFEVRDARSHRLVSRHSTEALAWAAVLREQRKVSSSHNKRGMQGGINASALCERIVVRRGLQ